MAIDWQYKIIRDPLYSYIGLTEKEVRLLDTKPMQRLRGIKQLARADLVYPSAIHSRFEHSLGALYVADLMAQKLNITGDKREVIRAAALLHDVGHGPFSHVFENVLEAANDGRKVSHEDIGRDIIANTEINEILGDVSSQLLELFDKQKTRSIARDIISSALDCDKLDYLRRDSYHTGVAYGVFDFHRIIYMLESEITRGEAYLVVREKGIGALNSFHLARFSMHTQVYQHHVRAISDAMIIRAAKIAFRENERIARKFAYTPGDADFFNRYIVYDDFSFSHELKNSEVRKAAQLVEQLEKRRLYKRGFETEISIAKVPGAQRRERLTKMEQREADNLEAQIADAAGIDRDFVIAYPMSIDNPLYRHPDSSLSRGGELLIRTRDGNIETFHDISPISGVTTKSVERFFVFCPDEYKDKVKQVAEECVMALA